MKWIEDSRLRQIVYFILFDIALFLFLYFLDREDGRARGLLIASFVSLFGILLLFLWTNRQSALLMATAIFFYLSFVLYWI